MAVVSMSHRIRDGYTSADGEAAVRSVRLPWLRRTYGQAVAHKAAGAAAGMRYILHTPPVLACHALTDSAEGDPEWL